MINRLCRNILSVFQWNFENVFLFKNMFNFITEFFQNNIKTWSLWLISFVDIAELSGVSYVSNLNSRFNNYYKIATIKSLTCIIIRLIRTLLSNEYCYYTFSMFQIFNYTLYSRYVIVFIFKLLPPTFYLVYLFSILLIHTLIFICLFVYFCHQCIQASSDFVWIKFRPFTCKAWTKT